MNRRQLLHNLGLSGLALPFLEALSPTQAYAQNPQIKRVLFVVHRHGTIPIRWAIGESSEYLLSELLQPLSNFRTNIVQLLGVHNPLPYLYPSPHIHGLAETTLLTANLPRKQLIYGRFLNKGPSIDQVIAKELSSGCPFPSINLSIGSDEGTAITNTHFLYDDAGNPVSSIANPVLAYQQLYGSSSFSSSRQQTQLDAIREQNTFLSGVLSSEDRVRLAQYQERLFELEQTILGGACSLAQPSQQNYIHNDDTIAEQQIQLLTEAFSCDYTRVGSLIFDHLEETDMSWAHDENTPLYDRASYRTWEDFIHYGNTNDDPDLFQGYLWYSKKVRSLLEALSSQTDIDGHNLLDSTAVIWLSNFENGAQHSLENLPIAIFGASSSAIGQLLDYRANPYSLCDVWLSLLQAIGSQQQSFGHAHPQARMDIIPDLF